ncbi:S13-like H2TH domain-containing protein [Clavulina sp. PMI_390]|nr:S13-like H2TH domain-containing protein [Clavulina sp. PMI_390]
MGVLLGQNLKDGWPIRVALTAFYGIGKRTALRVMARYSIHEGTKVSELTQAQVTALTSFLSSPATSPRPPSITLAQSFHPRLAKLAAESTSSSFKPTSDASSSSSSSTSSRKDLSPDPLSELKIETDLRRQILENIAHQRAVGSYVGRRHAMRLPVRGQNTRSNAKTARKLNRVERYA